MRIANNNNFAQPLSDGSTIPAGAVIDVDDAVGREALDRLAVSEVDQPAPAHAKAHKEKEDS